MAFGKLPVAHTERIRQGWETVVPIIRSQKGNIEFIGRDGNVGGAGLDG